MTHRTPSGMTLLECLYCTLILSALALATTPVLSWLEDMETQQAQAELRLLLNHARHTALQHNERYTLCPLHQNGQCSLPWQGTISVFKDNNGNRRLDADEQIMQNMQLAPSIRLHWRGTLPLHSLHFAGNGITHLSNGTFVLCRPQSATQRRIIINRQGRIRTSKSPTPCPV